MKYALMKNATNVWMDISCCNKQTIAKVAIRNQLDATVAARLNVRFVLMVIIYKKGCV